MCGENCTHEKVPEGHPTRFVFVSTRDLYQRNLVNIVSGLKGDVDAICAVIKRSDPSGSFSIIGAYDCYNGSIQCDIKEKFSDYAVVKGSNRFYRREIYEVFESECPT